MKKVMQFVVLSVVAAGITSSCRPSSSDGLFEGVDSEFDVGNGLHRNCTTGLPISASEFQVTRAGIDWHDEGRELDIILEYGAIEQFGQDIYSSIAFIDNANPTSEIRDPHPRSTHARARIMTGAGLSGDGTTYAEFWVVDDLANWSNAEVATISERVEILGNQIRISVPGELLGLSGPSDLRVGDWSWVAVSFSADDPEVCVETPFTAPWPLFIVVPGTVNS